MLNSHARIALCLSLLSLLVIAACSGDSSPAKRTAKSGEPDRSERVASEQQPVSSSGSGRMREGRLVTDTFEIEHAWDGNSLLLSIRSDLPGTTTLMVSVDRYYWETGSSNTYSLPYLSEKSTIGAWEGQPHRVPIDDSWWRDSLQAHQRLMARADMPYEVRRVGDSIHVGFTVPVNQDDPRFGPGNKNLVGEAVRQEGLRVVTKEVVLGMPMGQEPAPSPYVSRTALQAGQTYVLHGSVPIMPACDPGSASETMDAISRVYSTEPGAAIIVQEVISGGCPDGQVTDPWYRVSLFRPNGSSVGVGWINSTALIGQSVSLEQGGMDGSD